MCVSVSASLLMSAITKEIISRLFVSQTEGRPVQTERVDASNQTNVKDRKHSHQIIHQMSDVSLS